MEYNNLGRNYQVDSIEYDGEVINVFGTSITDMGMGYTVFFEGDEVYFETFEEAYNFAKDSAGNVTTDADNIEAFDAIVHAATPIIERVFNKRPGVSDTIVEDTDLKASTIYMSSIVNCECFGTDYNDDDVDQDDPGESDIRSAQYFEDIDIVKTALTEDDVDNLIKEVNIELEKANQPIRLTERATEFEYDYGEITLDKVNSYDVEQGDDGIGSYEYWGYVGYDSRPYVYLTNVEFAGTVPVTFDIEVEILR